MRTRKQIEGEFSGDKNAKLQLEVLLDMRALLMEELGKEEEEAAKEEETADETEEAESDGVW